MRFCLLLAIILKLSSCTKTPSQELLSEARGTVIGNQEGGNNPRRGFLSETERKLSSRMGDEALDVIKKGHDELLGRTSDKDILVFIGNSGSYFYHAIKTERDAFLVPLSAKPKSDSDLLREAGRNYYFYRKRLSLAKARRDGYRGAFIKPITDHATKSHKRIVLVAYSETEGIIDAFQNMLSDECPSCESVFLGLVPAKAYDDYTRSESGQVFKLAPLTVPKTVEIKGYVLLPQICLKIFNGGHFVPLTPNFPMEIWSTSSPTLMSEYESRPEVKALIDQISSIDWNSWSASAPN